MSPPGSPRLPFYLIAVGALFACAAVIAYAWVWQRGPYWDDYLWARESAWPTGPEPRLFRTLLDLWLGRQIESAEWVARLVCALFAVGAALTLGLLALEASRSTIAGVAVAILFAAPVPAFEAVLWPSAAAYPLGLTFAALGFVIWMRALLPSRRSVGLALAGVVCQVLAALCYEVFLPLLLLFPLFALLAAPSRSRLQWSVALSSSTLLLLGAGYAFLYRDAGVLGARGGFDLEPAELATSATIFVQWLGTYLLSSRYGPNLAFEELRLGLSSLASTPGGLVCLFAALVTLVATVARWPGPSREERLRGSLALVGIGLIWAALTLFVPTAFVRDQGLAPRLIYVPLAGLALATGGIVGALARISGGALTARVSVAIVGAILLVQSVQMAGVATALRARSAADSRQVEALATAIPANSLPMGTILVPLAFDERLFGRDDEKLSRLLTGAFEVQSISTLLVRERYARSDLATVTTDRYSLLRFERHTSGGELRVTIQGEDVPAARTVPFTYQAGRVHAIARLQVTQPDESTDTIEFPLVARLADAGVATQERLRLRGR